MRHRTVSVGVGLLAAQIALAGCGGHRATPRPDRSAPTADGRTIFARSCSGCHTLTGHEHGAPGGDLGYTIFTVSEIAGFAKIMPVKPPLSDSEARAVAHYIRTRARSLHGRVSY